MITAFIVIASVVLAAVFTIAWLSSPVLRRHIEYPKHTFQDQVQRYNQHCHDTRDEVKGISHEP